MQVMAPGERKMKMAHEDVYARILSRVEKDELQDQCRGVLQKEAKVVDRRIRGARRALQHAYDVNAAVQHLPRAQAASVAVAIAPMVKELEELHGRLALQMQRLPGGASKRSVADEDVEIEMTDSKLLKVEPQLSLAAVGLELTDVPTPNKGKKRRLRQDGTDSPRMPPRPGRLASEDDEESEPTTGPHQISNTSEDEEETDTSEDDKEADGEIEAAAAEPTEDEPIELDLLESESDTEADLAAYLEKARRLRKISSERRMSELPGLIRAVLTEIGRGEWTEGEMPRDLLGALSATLGASTTLKPAQREEIRSELNQLRIVAEKIDVTTAKQYPTLLGSKVRFLHSVEDLPHDEPAAEPEAEASHEDATETNQFDAIEDLHRATQQLSTTLKLPALEEMEWILQLVDHVFDNPRAARSKRYVVMVEESLRLLLGYVRALPRHTRRKQQCEELLVERLDQLKSQA